MPADLATALYTTANVRRIDRAAIDQHGIASYSLMQRAARAAFALLRRRWPRARRLCLLVGQGNNGGDALLLGELARHAGLEVVAVTIFDDADETTGEDHARAHAAFVEAGGGLISPSTFSALPDADVIVDGLFGTGLNRAIDGFAASLIEQVNASEHDVLALDIPSGLDADSGCCLGPTLRAQATISFVAWKRGLFTAAASDQCGDLELALLDIPAAARSAIAPDARLLDERIDLLLSARMHDSNKGDFGHVLAIGGDRGMAGAIRMTGEAALRVGAGLVTIATRSEHAQVLNSARPELMVRSVDDPQSLSALLDHASVVALGPGLGQSAWAHALWDSALRADRTCVMDADALNLLARAPLPLPKNAVLTPHPGEAARLLGVDTKQVQADRYGSVRELAVRYKAVVVLKGAGTLIADPDGHVAVCPWGNPGMASAGMGDVLTGVIAGMMAQGLSPWDAARLGVAVHGRAGDLAAGKRPRGLIASDLFDPLRTLVNSEPVNADLVNADSADKTGK
ncbi:MAG: NAD(P)H-hydrate dehydratase [Dokdonella sp.]